MKRQKSTKFAIAKRGARDVTRIVQSWDEMNYDVLVKIMRRVPLYDLLFKVCLVSKMWLSIVLDVFSSSRGVIKLKIMDSPKMHEAKFKRYCHFQKLMLDRKPADSWSGLFLGRSLLESNKYAYIAKRTPSLRSLVIPPEFGEKYSFMLPAMRYWKKLKVVQCPASLFKSCPGRFRMVRCLRLFGVVDDSVAVLLRDRCLRLKGLMLISCAFSMNALSTILDGHKQLWLLDTRHSFWVADCRRIDGSGLSGFVEWNEEEIRQKAAGIKVHLTCTLQDCVPCAAPIKCCYPEKKACRFRYVGYPGVRLC